MNVIKDAFKRIKLWKLTEGKNEYDIERFMSKYFVFAGVWKSQENHESNSLLAIFNLTVLTVGFLSISYTFILKYKDIDINTEILLHAVEIFHTICVQILFMRKKTEIKRLSEVFSITLDQMTLPVCLKDRCAAIILKERQDFIKVMKLSLVAISCIYAVIIYDSNAYGVTGEKKILYPTWFPFQTDMDHIGFYYLAVTFQALIYIELLFIDLAVVGIWYGTINAVSGILDILGLKLQSMEDVNVEERYSRLKNCIDLHNFAKDLVNNLNSCVGLIFLEVVLTSEVAICFCGFQVIQAVYTKESTRILKFVIGVGVFGLILFVYCAAGQKLKNKSEDFYTALYFCQWYEQSRSFKKSLYVCQTISKKTLVVNGANLVPANLHTFVNVGMNNYKSSY